RPDCGDLRPVPRRSPRERLPAPVQALQGSGGSGCRLRGPERHLRVAPGDVGRFSYAVARRLFQVAGYCWYEIDGACAREGVDPLALHPRRFLTLVYAWFLDKIQYADEQDRQMALDELHAPDRRKDPMKVSADVAAEEMELFRQAARQNSGGGA